MGRRLDRHGRLIEQPQLLGQGSRQSARTMIRCSLTRRRKHRAKELDEYGLEIRLPIGAVRQRCWAMRSTWSLWRSAIDRRLQTRRCCRSMAQIRSISRGQPSQYEVIVDFVRIESERLFDQRLVDRWTDRRMVNPRAQSCSTPAAVPSTASSWTNDTSAMDPKVRKFRSSNR